MRLPPVLLLLCVACAPIGATPSSGDPLGSGSTNEPPPNDPAPTSVNPACVTPASTAALPLALARQIPFDWFAWEVRAGRFLDENGDGVVDAADPQQLLVRHELGISLFDGGGEVLEVEDHWSTATLADLDGQPGIEAGVLHSGLGDGPGWSVIGPGGPVVEHGVTRADIDTRPWITDLERDGALELVTGATIRDAATGDWLADLAGAHGDAFAPVTADLDLDGVEEIVTFTPDDGVQVRDATGAVRATCWPGGGDWSVASFAIGDLDDDPEGEIVAAGDGFVAVCDTDGSLLASAAIDVLQPPMVGLGELDGDRAPEIVIGDAGALVVLDDDLTPLFDLGDHDAHFDFYPFALADLDGDGYHEIIVVEGESPALLTAYGGDGAVRGSIETPRKGSWVAQPIVADIDGDGLAEIVSAGLGAVSVYDDGVAGGWTIPGADGPWAGPDRFPGDRDALGRVTSAATPSWAVPESNVWNGLPTARHPAAGCP